MIALGSATGIRLGTVEQVEGSKVVPHPHVIERSRPISSFRRLLAAIPRWMIQGYQQANATDQASAVAFQALVAIVPMFLLLISIGGLFLRDASVLQEAILTIAWILPSSASGDAFTAAFEARSNSGLFGALGLLGFAWVGTGFVSALARSMNRIYKVPNAGYIKEKQRGFIVILLFALFFLIATAASIVTTLFVGNGEDLPVFFQRWVFASGEVQVIAYVVSLVSAFCLFITIYRLVPNAGQRMADVWPGAVISSVLFLAVTQVFPLYLRYFGSFNGYGVALGLISLMVATFYAIAHVILFGCYVNATWQRHRRQQEREQRRREQDGGGPPDGGMRPPDAQAARTQVIEQPLR